MNVFKSHPLPWRHDILTGNRYGQGIVYDANNQRVPHFPIISEDNERGQQAYEAITEALNENAELKQRIEEIEGFHANLLLERDSALQRIAELEAKIQALELDMDSFECTTQPNKQ